MTPGVAGTVLGEDDISDDRTANGGNAEVQRRPTSGLVQVSVLSQARLPQNIGGLPNDRMMGDRYGVDGRTGYRRSLLILSKRMISVGRRQSRERGRRSL